MVDWLVFAFRDEPGGISMRRLKWWLREKGQQFAPRLTLAVLARRSWLHEPEMALLPFLADPASTAIDAGANKGVYVHHMCKIYQRVIAFEPLPNLAGFLKRAARDAEVHGVALSDRHGEARLKLPVGFNELGTLEDLDLTDENTKIKLEEHVVPTLPLDSYNFTNVGLLKIDVEGHELLLLAGARELINSSQPTVLVEVEERHKPGSIAEVFKFFNERGYDGYFLDGNRFLPKEDFRLDQDQNQDCLIDSAKVGRYINNFIFIHKSQSVERTAAINHWLSSRAATS